MPQFWHMAMPLMMCTIISSTFATVLATDILTRKIMYYSPAVIGEDPHENEIDVYTSYFTNLHERDIPLIRQLGATHILVSDNWAADGSTAHSNFLRLLRDSNNANPKNQLKLIVTFAVPTATEDMTPADYLVLRDRAKQAFIKLIEEFSDGDWGDLLEAYNIPAAPADKLSTKELGMYYGVVNDLRALQESLRENASVPLPNFYVGYPIDSQTGKTSIYQFQSATHFTINFYYTEDPKQIFQDYRSAESGKPPQPIIPIFQVDNFSQINRTRDDQRQIHAFKTMFSIVQKTGGQKLEGMIVMELSDEWWRGDLSTAGYNVEGCPNGNAYAHTGCGIPIPGGDILSLEYMGLFEILDTPFHFCLVKKPLVNELQITWSVNRTEFNITTDPICAQIDFVIPWMAVAPMGALSLIFLVVILIIPPPSVPSKRNNEVEMKSLLDNEK